MKTISSRFWIVAVLILHLGLSFSDLQHAERLALGGRDQESVVHHECPPGETHASPEVVHFCIPCHRLLIGTPLHSCSPSTVTLPEYRLTTPASLETFSANWFPSIYHRGPPALHPVA